MKPEEIIFPPPYVVGDIVTLDRGNGPERLRVTAVHALTVTVSDTPVPDDPTDGEGVA